MQNITAVEDITLETLKRMATYTSYTDHIYHFEVLFDIIKPKVFLEWGCGFSTKIFLDNSEKVISVEFDTPGTSTEWFFQCKELYKDQLNWTPILYEGSEEMFDACAYQCSFHKDYSKISEAPISYITELDEYIKCLLATNDITVSFVDANVYIRGDMVELSLQNRIPIVIAHDTANSYPDYPSLVERKVDCNQYGWFKIEEHPEYEKIFINHGTGTMFWIRKDLPHVIKKMKEYDFHEKADYYNELCRIEKHEEEQRMFYAALKQDQERLMQKEESIDIEPEEPEFIKDFKLQLKLAKIARQGLCCFC